MMLAETQSVVLYLDKTTNSSIGPNSCSLMSFVFEHVSKVLMTGDTVTIYVSLSVRLYLHHQITDRSRSSECLIDDIMACRWNGE